MAPPPTESESTALEASAGHEPNEITVMGGAGAGIAAWNSAITWAGSTQLSARGVSREHRRVDEEEASAYVVNVRVSSQSGAAVVAGGALMQVRRESGE